MPSPKSLNLKRKYNCATIGEKDKRLKEETLEMNTMVMMPLDGLADVNISTIATLLDIHKRLH
jgi:hypothetical protein